MLSSELRNAYLKFFEERGHLIHPSDSLVPDDPTLFYTSAGMVQFKPYFAGDRMPPRTRMTTCQKCLRTDDVEEVGDAAHHTFFEMLGNFSFGDYFKKEAIAWAWEFITERLKIDPNRIYVSIYLTDDEADAIWREDVGLPADRITRLGEDKNYWPANAPSKGPNGPCGPDTEIFVDMGAENGCGKPDCGVACDCGRYVEIWNLVFMQFYRHEGGVLTPLPKKNIDTGMGVERVTAVLEGTATDYETDLFLPIIKKIEKISSVSYNESDVTDVAMRIVADHVRGATFAIADGVMPSNEGRGYVLRRIIRRAVLRGAQVLGLDKLFMPEITPVVVDLMKEQYPEVFQRQTFVESVVRAEEQKFRRTLDTGMQRLEELIGEVTLEGEPKLSGEAAFTLYDTYGFPFEMTQEIAQTRGITVDAGGYEAALEEQRARGKASLEAAGGLFGGGAGVITELEKTVEPTQFLGYEQTSSTANVVALVKGGELVKIASEGDKVDVILDQTPFYAESGGQIGDTGEIRSPSALVAVRNTTKAAGIYLHSTEVTTGEISVGDEVEALVDIDRRAAIARSHTATHLLHAALRDVLGEHALQSGSVVEPDRFRFDFSHFAAVTPEELAAVEDQVNRKILEDLEANVIETSIDEARKMGAMALFGEKYGERVRVVKVGDYSTELCGGTHLTRTSRVGSFKILGESSVGAGLRRIEAVTGLKVLDYIREQNGRLDEVAMNLGTPVSEVVQTSARVMTQLKETQKQLEQIQAKGAAAQAGDLAGKAQEFAGVKVVASRVNTNDISVLSSLADGVADRLKSGVVLLGGVGDGRITFVCKVTSDLAPRGFHAGNLIREVAKVTGGGGGGRPEFAQAGGKDVSKLDEALSKGTDLVRQRAESNG